MWLNCRIEDVIVNTNIIVSAVVVIIAAAATSTVPGMELLH